MTVPPRLVARVPAAGGGRGGQVSVAAGEIVSAPRPVVDALAGHSGVDRGVHVEVDGHRIRGASLARRVRGGIAVVSGTAVAPDVSVRDHLIAASSAATGDRVLAAGPLLRARGADPAGVLSGGERRVLGWLTAIAVDPKVVVLDRAGTGLDDDTLQWAHTTLDAWLDAGVAVVVASGRVEEERWVTHRADGTPRAASGP